MIQLAPIIIDPQGATVEIDIANQAEERPVTYTSANATTEVELPATLSTVTSLFVPRGATYTVTVSLNGEELNRTDVLVTSGRLAAPKIVVELEDVDLGAAVAALGGGGGGSSITGDAYDNGVLSGEAATVTISAVTPASEEEPLTGSEASVAGMTFAVSGTTTTGTAAGGVDVRGGGLDIAADAMTASNNRMAAGGASAAGGEVVIAAGATLGGWFEAGAAHLIGGSLVTGDVDVRGAFINANGGYLYSDGRGVAGSVDIVAGEAQPLTEGTGVRPGDVTIAGGSANSSGADDIDGSRR